MEQLYTRWGKELDGDHVLQEYPRPLLQRKSYVNLNGYWDYAITSKFMRPETYDGKILVPFSPESVLSGVGRQLQPEEYLWYRRTLSIDAEKLRAGFRLILHFGAVDQSCRVYVNGREAARHTGGYLPFSADITEYCQGKETLPGGPAHPRDNEAFIVRESELVLAVRDLSDTSHHARGKQKLRRGGMFYTAQSGIWQTVWLEVVERQHIRQLYLTPLYDEGKIKAELEMASLCKSLALDYDISFRKEIIAAGRVEVFSSKVSFVADLFQEHIFRMNYHGESWAWTPETPNLFDLRLTLRGPNGILDEVSSYFGMRKIETKAGMVYLNNMPYYQKLVLDQGYWKEGLLTAPSDKDYAKDIRLAKEMGFNGCRKHQKTEDPRFLYWADMLGYLVWGECAAPAVFNRNSAERLMTEWKDILRRDYNHPCIVTWVPVNESWGVPDISFDRRQQHFSQALYHYLHTLDPTRPVISNDGWAATETDIVGIHNYAHGRKGERERQQYFEDTLSSRENLIRRHSSPWPVFAEGFSYGGEPILLTEFGGIAYDVSGESGWGYTSVETEQDFLQEYQRIMEAVCRSKALWGYCYTQLTDVEQEINGLLTYDRRPKCDPAGIREINHTYHASVVE